MELEKNFLRQFSFDISPFVSIRTFDSGQPIVVEGEPPAFLYYMSGGRAKLYTTQENGRVSLIDFLDAPCFIGEMELLREDSLTQRRHSHSALPLLRRRHGPLPRPAAV